MLTRLEGERFKLGTEMTFDELMARCLSRKYQHWTGDEQLVGSIGGENACRSFLWRRKVGPVMYLFWVRNKD